MINNTGLISALLILSLIAPFSAFSEDRPTRQAVEITTTSRIYYPEQMGFSHNTPILDVILAIVDGKASTPAEMLNNYTVKLDGGRIMEDLSVFLSNIRVCDIEKISYNNFQTAKEGAQGLLGSISITSKTNDAGIHGFADMAVTTREDIRSSLRLKSHYGKWNASAQISWRRMGLKNDTTTENITPEGSYCSTDKIDGDRFFEDGFLRATYTGKKDFLSMLIVQQYGHKKGNEVLTRWDDGLFDGKCITLYKDKSHMLNFQLEWKHDITAKTRLETTFQTRYSYTPETFTDDYEGEYYAKLAENSLDYRYRPRNNYYYGELRISCNEVRNLNLFGGVDFYSDNARNNKSVQLQVVEEMNQRYSLHSLCAAPHINASYELGKFSFSAGYRLNILRRDARLNTDTNWGKCFYNSMWDMLVGWNINPASKLIASYSHKISEQSIIQLFPQYLFSLDDFLSFTKGNEHLKLPQFDVIDLSYVLNRQRLSFMLKGRFCHNRNSLTQYMERKVQGEGFVVEYYGWRNDVTVNSVNLDAELYLRFGCFSTMIALAYNHQNYIGSKTDDSWMVRILPVLSLPRGFNITAALSYLSRFSSSNVSTKSYWYGRLRVNKDIGKHWSVYAQMDNPFSTKIRTQTTDAGSLTRVVQNSHDTQAVFGIFYNF